jgi:curved DNA-binding protein CbpA
MGNENSTQQNNNNNEFIKQLQQQILQNQVEIQRLQINNLQQNPTNFSNYNSNSNNNSILHNPTLQNQIKNNPRMKKELLHKILSEHGNSITHQQRQKINNLLIEIENDTNTSKALLTNIGTRSYDNNTRNELVRTQNNNYQNLTSSLQNDEERAKRDYELQQQRLKVQYQNSQRKRKLEYDIKMKEMKNNLTEAKRLFQLNSKFTIEELKNAYKKLALKTHPDRPSGSNAKFQFVTKCYFLLIEQLKKEEENKSFIDLKKASKTYIKKQNNKPSTPTSKQNFNLKLFNKIFEENKIYDENDEGYDEWLTNNGDNKQPELFSDKFNLDVFNNTFNNHKSSNPHNQLIEYKEPEALVSCDKLTFTTLDGGKKGSFNKWKEQKNDLEYSDLKSAYTNGNLINPNGIKYKTYKNIDELERTRANISYNMTPEELAKEEAKKKYEQEKEEERIQRVQQRDNLVSNHYLNVHERLLGYKSGPDLSR